MNELESIETALQGLKLQIAECERALWDLATTPRRGRPTTEMRMKKKGTLAELVQIVADEFGCEAEAVRGRSQIRFLTRARNAFCLLAYQHTGHSYPSIAQFLRRHSTSAMSSVERARWQCAEDPRYGQKVKACEARFLGGEKA